MTMKTNTLNTIDRNMDQQNRYVKEILELIDECEEEELLEDVSETEIRQLREHCGDIAMAANTTKKLVKNLKPLAERLEAEQKAEEEAKKKKAEEEVKKKKEAAPKKKAKPAEPEPTEEEDMDFLG